MGVGLYQLVNAIRPGIVKKINTITIVNQTGEISNSSGVGGGVGEGKGEIGECNQTGDFEEDKCNKMVPRGKGTQEGKGGEGTQGRGLRGEDSGEGTQRRRLRGGRGERAEEGRGGGEDSKTIKPGIVKEFNTNKMVFKQVRYPMVWGEGKDW